LSEKSPTVAVLLSFLFTGIGLIYLGNTTKGILIFTLGVLCNVLGVIVLGFFHYLSILTWIFGIYITYKDSKKIKRKPVKQYQYTRKVRHYDRDYDRYY
jgi:TM2 domain-containing membrane protein YozV